ncbi:MAG: hypothetical protein JXB15_10170 [Anaerolineales bacterium]|nr:hypothetical protein [Anaerolineales bacterium]
MDRFNDLQWFYSILKLLENKLGGKRLLASCDGRMNWPPRGVYFFFEPGELRVNTGEGLRVVRVGTHALATRSQTTLWHRLRQHQGTLKNGGGNHRGSVFRFHVGTALIERDSWPQAIADTWDRDSSVRREVRLTELPLEQAVSQYIRQMPFLWLAVEEAPGPESLRGVIERNAIALLSNFNAPIHPLDPPSKGWLGRWAKCEPIRSSGLWNVKHVAEIYDPAFLDILDRLVKEMKP